MAGEATGIDKAGNKQLEVQDEVVFGGLAFMDEAVQQGEGYLDVAEHSGPFAEGGVGGDDNRGALLETAD